MFGALLLGFLRHSRRLRLALQCALRGWLSGWRLLGPLRLLFGRALLILLALQFALLPLCSLGLQCLLRLLLMHFLLILSGGVLGCDLRSVLCPLRVHFRISLGVLFCVLPCSSLRLRCFALLLLLALLLALLITQHFLLRLPIGLRRAH